MARLMLRSKSEIAESEWIETIWQQPIQRIFWIYGVPEADFRGGHRHHTCRMVLQCVTGSVELYVQTPTNDQYFTLASPDQYVFLEAQDWRLMHRFSPDAVLVVFASKLFETTVYYESPYRPIILEQPATAASNTSVSGR